MLEFSKWPKTPGIIFKKKSLALKGINCLEVIFAMLDKIVIDMLQMTKKWNWKWTI